MPPIKACSGPIILRSYHCSGERTIRTATKPSTAKCDLDTYTLFLLAEPKYPGCTRLAEILEGLSHDSVNRFLLRERYDPKDLFDEVKSQINLSGGTLSGDDTVIDKPYSDPSLTELIGYYWSGKHHRVVKGVHLITLYYTEKSGKSVPVNYRLYNKQEGQTKNDYFREMITEVLSWGLMPKMVTSDTWYLAPIQPEIPKRQGIRVANGHCQESKSVTPWRKVHPNQKFRNTR